MLKNIRQYFESHIQSVSGGQPHSKNERALQLATASLLIEVSRVDFHVSADEKKAVTEAVEEMFELSAEETHELVALAESEVDDATCLYEFTRLVNENFSYEQKLKVVENMWRVAYSDLDKDKYEEHVIRKVCELIYVSHKDFVRLRHAIETA